MSYSAVLANRKFTSLLLGQVISLLGDVMLNAALAWLIFALAGTATSISYLGIAFVAPNVLFSLFAGVFVDRSNRRRVMIISDTIRGLLVLLVPIMYYVHALSLNLLYLIVFVVSSASAFFLPARVSILPQIVSDKDQLASANSLMNGMFEATRLVGFAASGVFIALFTSVGAATFDSITFFISACAIVAMGAVASPAVQQSSQNVDESVIRDLSEGLAYVWKNFVIRIVLLSAMLGNFFLNISLGFTVVFAREALKVDAVGYGTLLAANALGLVSGSLAAGKLGVRKHLGLTLILTTITYGLAIFAQSPLTQLFVALPLIVVFGFSLALYNVSYVNMLQATVPNKILGRVMSLDQVLSFATIPISLAIGGPLIDLIGIRAAYILSGGMVVLIGAATFLPRELRNFSY